MRALNGKPIQIHGQKLWVYATVDGRDFKVWEDPEDGAFEIRERTGDDTWEDRTSEPGFVPLANDIMADALGTDF